MSDTRVFAGGLLAMAVAGGAAFLLFSQTSATAQVQTDEPGPYMVIEMGGSVSGTIEIDLDEQNAPNHAARLKLLAEQGNYDKVAFHRVIEDFMAQTGDVQYGKVEGGETGIPGTGGSSEPDLNEEFSEIPYERGVVGMARTDNPNSANSQFFIMFAPAPYLNEKYTVVGRVTKGMEVVDQITRGPKRQGGAVANPDWMEQVTIRP